MKHPTLQPVKSSNLQSVGFDDRGLWVRFAGGGLYQYKDAPKAVYDEILAAESPGKVFREKARHLTHIRHDA